MLVVSEKTKLREERPPKPPSRPRQQGADEGQTRRERRLQDASQLFLVVENIDWLGETMTLLPIPNTLSNAN